MNKARWTGSALALVLLASGADAQVAPDPATPVPNDFRIDPQPAPPPPPPAAETPAPAPVPEPTPVPTPGPVVVEAVPPVQADPVPPRRRPRVADRVRPTRAQPRDTAPAQIDEAPVAETPPVVPQDLAPAAQAEPAAPVVADTQPTATTTVEERSGSLLPIAAGVALALAALLAGLLWHRRKPAIVWDEPVYADQDTAEPEPEMIDSDPVPAAIPLAHVARPNLSIDFKPAAAGATDAIASVDYALVVTNTGDAPASKVRMEARMFAMGPDHDAALAAFFAGPLVTPTPIASAVPPGVEAALRAQVTLPRDAVNPIQVRDRTVFVPLVAFNLLYEWYDADGGLQHGQTAMSYVVGRENRPPAAKMAPFRLDQGPRIYREVGQRVHQVRQVA